MTGSKLFTVEGVDFMLVCPVCGCSVITVVRTLTVIEDGNAREVDLLECTKCGYQEKENKSEY